MDKKLAIVIGHNAAAQGAVRRIDGISEFAWNGALADLIEEVGGDRVRIFRREKARSYSAEIDAVYAAVDQWGADASIELHFNSAASPLATGTKTLSSGSAGSRALALACHVGMIHALGLRDRGVEVRGRADRGGRSLFAGRAPAVLIEPYFGSNDGDAVTADQCRNALAVALWAAFEEWAQEVAA
ncbi:MAG: N-acetylmuramoyl-L-alanine amidase [Alteromonadaceae bacterium]|nr:N-acetylmuramoyl-L-alanine amidase [Alteromonadaceae bacterium]